MIQFLNNKTQKNNYCHFPESTGEGRSAGRAQGKVPGSKQGRQEPDRHKWEQSAPGKSRYSTTRFGHVHVFMGNHVYGCTSG